MGGNLAWTIRLEDNTEYRMDRWTNTMPTLIINPAFLSGTQSAIDEALESWLAMKDDWEANKDTEDYALPMTGAYAPYPYGLMPSEYGLVVTDFVTKTILSLQGYSNFGKLNAVRLSFGESASEMFPDREEQLEAFAAEGRVSSYHILLNKEAAAQRFVDMGGTIEEDDRRDAWWVNLPGSADYADLKALCDQVLTELPPHPNADVIAEMTSRQEVGDLSVEDAEKLGLMIKALESQHAMQERPIILCHAVPDLAPFTLEQFDESAEGYVALHARVLELGFTLSVEEEKAWADRIAEMQESEEEDA
ncbi:hypothetical protein ACOI1H_20000 [Loktanella sp. DJP18]|uniref:hypothetical protein n=1 Tax=Loktanella sp. DJP18 TaxID=3409788 RepID=UPI003BB66543